MQSGTQTLWKNVNVPAQSPSVYEFRKTLLEYSYTLVLKFKSQAQVSPEVAKLLSKDENDPSLTEEMREKIHAFLVSWKKEKLNLLKMVRVFFIG